MTRYPSTALRVWRTAPWAANPMMRLSDRVEGAVRILAIVVALAAIPVCGAIGTARYDPAVAEIAAANARKTEVTAVIVDDPVLVSSSHANGAYDEKFESTVRWSDNGTSGQATVGVGRKAHPGDRMPLWLGPDGRPAGPPLPASAAVWRAAGLGAGTLVETWAAVGAVVLLISWLLQRRHRRCWTREWRQIARPIGQDT
ncbi:hypothetical protein BJY24_005619 [Nocardia transvalensis]|uniref:Transmembrane protein n=1 Tax=Nocardia transvalensis TaxID=37333 RepID=A0A7W9PIJ0_9NOCA|nr:hypothetical protein [Nocardia transvalensis]MBB5916707.1 hypothetical protein [Nocardia transvalensis]